MGRGLLDLALSLPEGLAPTRMAYLATLAGRLGFSAVYVELPPTAARDVPLVTSLRRAAAPAALVVDDPATTGEIIRGSELESVRVAHADLLARGEDRRLIVAVPISIGRTLGEATARADREPGFAGSNHPRECGIFGTFEQAQEQVLALARAGAGTLLVTVPDEEDVADLLAQIRALVVGATPVIHAMGAGGVPPQR